MLCFMRLDARAVILSPFQAYLRQIMQNTNIFSNELQAARARILNVVLYVFAAFSIPLVILLTVRDYTFGWKNITYFQILFSVMVIVLALSRHWPSFRVRALTLLGLWFIHVAWAAITWGLPGGCWVSAIMLVSMTTIFFGFRAGIVTLVITSTTLGIIGLGFYQGWIFFNYNVSALSASMSNWAVLLIVTALFSFMIAASIGIIFKIMGESILSLVRRSNELQEKSYIIEILFEKSSDAKFVIDGDVFVDCNASAVEMLGYASKKELLGKKPSSTSPEKQPDGRYSNEKVSEMIKIAFKKGIHRFEWDHKRANGEVLPVEVLLTAIPYKNRQILYVVWRDISEQKQAEKEKAQLETHLQQAQKMEAIGTLAGGIAHDFNNILTIIMGYAELSLYSVSNDPVLESNLEEMLKASERAKSLVQQILTFSRRHEQERKPIQIGNIIKEATKLLRASIPTTIDVRCHVAPDIGLVLADYTQIHQILMNLCTNAGHAMEESGGILEITLDPVNIAAGDAFSGPLSGAGRYVCLTVKDTGHGIPPDTVERIFEPYFTTKEQGKGTGLGLAVVHGIVKSHKGSIIVDSKPGKGTTFKIFFPELSRSGLEEAAKDSRTPLPRGAGRVLFIDDEEIIVNMARKMLEQSGYKVTTVNDSRKALELFESDPGRFDIVITDQTMPGITGDALAAGMLKIRPDIPIILCTGYSSRIDEHKAKQIGIRDFLMKPLSLTQLAGKIREALDISP